MRLLQYLLAMLLVFTYVSTSAQGTNVIHYKDEPVTETLEQVDRKNFEVKLKLMTDAILTNGGRILSSNPQEYIGRKVAELRKEAAEIGYTGSAMGSYIAALERNRMANEWVQKSLKTKDRFLSYMYAQHALNVLPDSKALKEYKAQTEKDWEWQKNEVKVTIVPKLSKMDDFWSGKAPVEEVAKTETKKLTKPEDIDLDEGLEIFESGGKKGVRNKKTKEVIIPAKYKIIVLNYINKMLLDGFFEHYDYAGFDNSDFCKERYSSFKINYPINRVNDYLIVCTNDNGIGNVSWENENLYFGNVKDKSYAKNIFKKDGTKYELSSLPPINGKSLAFINSYWIYEIRFLAFGYAPHVNVDANHLDIDKRYKPDENKDCTCDRQRFLLQLRLRNKDGNGYNDLFLMPYKNKLYSYGFSIFKGYESRGIKETYDIEYRTFHKK